MCVHLTTEKGLHKMTFNDLSHLFMHRLAVDYPTYYAASDLLLFYVRYLAYVSTRNWWWATETAIHLKAYSNLRPKWHRLTAATVAYFLWQSLSPSDEVKSDDHTPARHGNGVFISSFWTFSPDFWLRITQQRKQVLTHTIIKVYRVSRNLLSLALLLNREKEKSRHRIQLIGYLSVVRRSIQKHTSNGITTDI